jgi:putative DNA primase/helicase
MNSKHGTSTIEEMDRNAHAAGTVVELKPLSAYRMENIRWLWPGWLARGKLHLLAGPPGVAKTTLGLNFAATLSTKGQWPDGTRAPQGDIVIWSGEDSITDTLKPRLIAMGAYPARIHIVHAVNEEGLGPRPFNPATDMKKLGVVLKQLAPTLLILDPISSAIVGDSHKAAEVRKDLQPLVDLAERLDFALLGITHFAKGTQGNNPLERVMGSVALTGGARLVMVAVKSADEGRKNRIARAKSNIGPDGGGFEYQLVQTVVREPDGEVEVGAQIIDWGQALEGTARDLLAVEEPENKADALTTAVTFLKELLQDGPIDACVIEERAEIAGVRQATLRRAKDKLGIKSCKKAMEDGWEWALPVREDAQ